ncbi:universal stress protein [Planosporangium thailandense]|uniref:universal stress protein n=1 Tax=Planosporangium thailandense TaxID=765197 RepID=UPI00197BB938|nr:universal stress protein [Planosporangium thailandense]
MRTVVWITEGTWEACVDAARDSAPGQVVLVHAPDPALDAAMRGARLGLLGRWRHTSDPEIVLERAITDAVDAMFAAAERRLGRPCVHKTLRGRPEREVVAACAGADLLILARDGDHSRLGPASLGRETRFVVDHAPCRVLLVWPDEPPDLATLPPQPPDQAGPHPPDQAGPHPPDQAGPHPPDHPHPQPPHPPPHPHPHPPHPPHPPEPPPPR